MEEIKYPQYLINKPIGEDHFEGKSHERIANSIADHIKSKAVTLRLLGLEGVWGSGKSNIIELLRSKLIDTHHIYIYDAWGHQEDSQRRAFLEELTENLIENDSNLLSDNTLYKDLTGKETKITWNEKLKYLLARKRETNKKTVPELSVSIILIGLIIVLTPILVLMAEFLDKVILKILFSLSIILITFFCCGIYAIWKRYCSNEESWPNLSSLFYFYKGKELENTTYEIFSDLEPSVKEFKDWIRSISLGLKNKELVIVYDNMDRLPPNKVKEIWSSIHTFFAEQDYDKINVIIPFDRNHLKLAFEDKGNVSDQFINKTFSIIYRVTPPVLTDWKNFFKIKYEHAFGETEKAEFLTVLSVFDRLVDRFTPRDIIIFINELVTYKRIWNDEIPLRYIATYSLRKEVILKSPQKIILSGVYLGASEDLFVEDDRLQNYISALAFNVPVEKASQVLLVRELEIFLRSYNKRDINKFTKHSHFIAILEEVIRNSDIIIDSTIESLSNLDTSKIIGTNIKERVEGIWGVIVAKQCTKHVKKLSFEVKYQKMLMNSSKRNNQRLLKYLIKGFNEFDEIQGENYFIAFQDLESYVSEKGISLELNEKIKQISVSPETFFNYLSVAKSEYKKYKLSTNPSKLDTYISDTLPNESFLIIDKVDLSYIVSDYNFNTTIDTIENLIAQNKLNKDNFNNIISIYKSISKEKPVSKLINEIHLHPLIQNIATEDPGYFDLIAMRLIYANSYNTQIAKYRWQDNTISILSLTDESFVKEISKVIENYLSFGKLLLLTIIWSKPLLNLVCKDLILNSYGAQRLSITTVLPKFKEIMQVTGVSEQELLNSLNRWSEIGKKDITISNLKDIIPEFSFFERSTSYSFDLTNHLNRLAKDYIKSMEENELIEEWGNDNSYGYNILYIFMEASKIRVLPVNIFKSIKLILEQISESDIGIPANDTIWKYFIVKAGKKEISPTIKNVIDYFIRENNITDLQFNFFENLFREFGNFDKKSGEISRTILGKIASKNSCFDIILSNKKFYIPIINNANEDAFDFKEHVSSRLEADQDNIELKNFASAINVFINNEDDIK